MRRFCSQTHYWHMFVIIQTPLAIHRMPTVVTFSPWALLSLGSCKWLVRRTGQPKCCVCPAQPPQGQALVLTSVTVPEVGASAGGLEWSEEWGSTGWGPPHSLNWLWSLQWVRGFSQDRWCPLHLTAQRPGALSGSPVTLPWSCVLHQDCVPYQHEPLQLPGAVSCVGHRSGAWWSGSLGGVRSFYLESAVSAWSWMAGTLSGWHPISSWLSHQPSVLTFAAVTLGKVMAWRKQDSDMLSRGLPFVESTRPLEVATTFLVLWRASTGVGIRCS
jgi:hypothetical protein